MVYSLAARSGLVLKYTETDQLDLGGRKQLLKLPASEKTCTQLLEAGDLYGDIARSLDTSRGGIGEDAPRCYKKLLLRQQPLPSQR